jgi:transcriptional regulator with XRE-family HTH domain
MRNNLIKFRGDRSQEEMAQIYNVTQQAWSNWENGRDTPRPATMLLISKDSGMSIESLFFDDYNNEKLLDDTKPTGTDC